MQWRAQFRVWFGQWSLSVVDCHLVRYSKSSTSAVQLSIINMIAERCGTDEGKTLTSHGVLK